MKEAVRIEKQIETRATRLASVQSYSYRKNITHIQEEKKGQSQLLCQICNKNNHTAKDCFKIKPCELCKQVEHSAKYCKQNRTHEVNIICQLCNKFGHAANTCNQSSNARQTATNCQLCNRSGHTAATCNLNKGNQTSSNNQDMKVCRYCKNIGHLINECRKLQYRNAQGNDNNLPAQSVRPEIPQTKSHSTNQSEMNNLINELLPSN